MENPAYFTVLSRADGTDWDLTDAGLFGSLLSAGDEAAKRLANTDVPGVDFAVAVVTMLDQDPITGTPLGHLDPPNATGYALASLNVTDPAHRGIGHTLFKDFEMARAVADTGRARNRSRGNDTVLDVVALTIFTPHPAV